MNLRPMLWRGAGLFIPFARVARSLLPSPLQLITGKPLERWLLIYDLGARILALGNDAKTVETVMLDRDGAFPKSPALLALLAPLIGTGVFGQPGGPAVRDSRRMFIRALGQIQDAEIVDVCRTVTQSYVDRWLRRGIRHPVPICSELSRLTVDIVSQCTLGCCFDEAESERFARLFFDYHRRCLPLLLLIAEREPEVHRRLARRMGLETTGAEMRHLVRQRFLAPLLAGDRTAVSAPFSASLRAAGLLPACDDGGSGSDPALDEITVMLLAGHETTASVMSWLLWELARRPEDQEAAAASLIRESVGDPHHPARTGSAHRWQGIDGETLSSGLIREAMRLYPPIAFFLRETVEEVRFREKSVPRHSFFVISPWTLHRHRKKWDRPDEFAPERWWQQPREPARSSYMPFGMGPRTCPGAHFAQVEMREILRVLLTRCDFALTTGEAPRPLGHLTSRPDREIHLSVKLRSEQRLT